jgi:hypothetical protein
MTLKELEKQLLALTPAEKAEVIQLKIISYWLMERLSQETQ